MTDEGVGGAFPASVPVPAEDAPRPETGPEDRIIEERERTEEDAIEANASEGEAATEPAEGASAGEVPAAESAPEAEAEGGT